MAAKVDSENLILDDADSGVPDFEIYITIDDHKKTLFAQSLALCEASRFFKRIIEDGGRNYIDFTKHPIPGEVIETVVRSMYKFPYLFDKDYQFVLDCIEFAAYIGLDIISINYMIYNLPRPLKYSHIVRAAKLSEIIASDELLNAAEACIIDRLDACTKYVLPKLSQALQYKILDHISAYISDCDIFMIKYRARDIFAEHFITMTPEQNIPPEKCLQLLELSGVKKRPYWQKVLHQISDKMKSPSSIPSRIPIREVYIPKQ